MPHCRCRLGARLAPTSASWSERSVSAGRPFFFFLSQPPIVCKKERSRSRAGMGVCCVNVCAVILILPPGSPSKRTDENGCQDDIKHKRSQHQDCGTTEGERMLERDPLTSLPLHTATVRTTLPGWPMSPAFSLLIETDTSKEKIPADFGILIRPFHTDPYFFASPV